MKLYLLRHGDAAAGLNDSLRPLTDQGKQDVQRVIGTVFNLVEPIGRIYASPKLRAIETAQIAAAGFGGTLEPIQTDLLKPGANAVQATRYFADHSTEEEAILLVTHQPFVGNFMDFLTDNQGLGTRMSTSCFACLDLPFISQGVASLEWIKSP